MFGVKAEPAAETPLGRRTRSIGIVINEGDRRASSSAPPRYVKPKTELGPAAVKTELGLAVMKTKPGLAGGVKEELDDAAALKWAREVWARMELERQCRAYERFAVRRRGRDEGGVVVLDDSDDDASPPPIRQGDAGQGSSRGGSVKEEKANNDEDGGDVGDFAALSDFFGP